MYGCPRGATILSVDGGVVWGLDRDTFRSIVLGANQDGILSYECAIEKSPLLQDLRSSERCKLASAMQKREFKDGSIVIRQGDVANAMFLITSGTAKVTRHLEHTHQEMEITTLTQGQYFGEVALLTRKRRAASVWAQDKLTCARVSRKSFERLLGPCVDIMKRRVGGYEERLKQLFGPSEGSSYLGLELAGL
jgi:cAMP-dependent protein kinase regulator